LKSFNELPVEKLLLPKLAYELYEQRGRQNGQTDQDLLQAEREIKLEATR
jgi:hypothetical protein